MNVLNGKRSRSLSETHFHVLSHWHANDMNALNEKHILRTQKDGKERAHPLSWVWSFPPKNFHNQMGLGWICASFWPSFPVFTSNQKLSLLCDSISTEHNPVRRAEYLHMSVYTQTRGVHMAKSRSGKCTSSSPLSLGVLKKQLGQMMWLEPCLLIREMLITRVGSNPSHRR